jgi:alkylated DNA repair dioxygenase AlkB
MPSLFDSPTTSHRVDLPEADIVVYPSFLPPSEAAAVFKTLRAETEWAAETFVILGKVIPVPRLQAWIGDPHGEYKYGGINHVPLPWTPTLTSLRERAETIADHRFTNVLVNLYRNGADSVALHADDERVLGPEPVIASLSLGATRTFHLRHKAREHPSIKLPLEDGALLIMRGATQRCWEHGVPKTKRPVGERINLTFRRMGVA